MHKTAAWPLALIYTALIVYASLYPFEGWRYVGIAPWSFLGAPLPRYWTGFDVAANPAGYAPLGFLLALSALRTNPRLPAVLLATVGAALLSLAMESLQTYLPKRVASNVDLTLNLAGAWLGALAAFGLEKAGAIARWSRFRDRWFVAASRGALVLLNDGDLTYAKIRLDPRSLASAVEHIDTITDSLARALVWGAAWDMTRDAEMSTGAFLETVAGGLADETEVGMVQQVLRQADSAVALYAAPENRGRYAAQMADMLDGLTRGARPGSDHQLAYMRGFSVFAASPEHVALLRGLLDGTTTIDGLAIDTDLRWTLLTRLVVLGEAGNQEIEEELARDDTAAGRLYAATCRAAIPTPEAKAAAWHACLHDTSLPNHMLSATIAGIAVPRHRELLRPHVEEYFDALPDVWKQRTNEIAQEITLGLFPSALVEAAIVERTDAVLHGAVAIPRGGMRLLAEGRDGTLRALRCQQRDGA